MTSNPSACERFLNALIGGTNDAAAWATDRSHGVLQGRDGFTYGVMMRFSKRPEKTKTNFIASATYSWPEGKRGQMGMHFDAGFLRCVDDKTLEWNIANNNGANELLRGPVTETMQGGARARLDAVGDTSTVMPGRVTRRELELKPAGQEGLIHTFYMTGNDGKLFEHLREQMAPVKKADLGAYPRQ